MANSGLYTCLLTRQVRISLRHTKVQRFVGPTCKYQQNVLGHDSFPRSYLICPRSYPTCPRSCSTCPRLAQILAKVPGLWQSSLGQESTFIRLCSSSACICNMGHLDLSGWLLQIQLRVQAHHHNYYNMMYLAVKHYMMK